MTGVKQGGSNYHFLKMTRPGIEPRSPGPLVNTLPIGPMSRYIYIYSLSSYGQIGGQTDLFNLGMANSLKEEKL